MEKVPDKLTHHTSLVCHPPSYCENTPFFPQLPVQAFPPLPVGKSPANIKASLQLVLRTPTVRNRSSRNGKCSHTCVTHGSGGQDVKGVIGPRSRAGARGWNGSWTSWDPSQGQNETIKGCPLVFHLMKESRSVIRFLTPAKCTLQFYFTRYLLWCWKQYSAFMVYIGQKSPVPIALSCSLSV